MTQKVAGSNRGYSTFNNLYSSTTQQTDTDRQTKYN